MRRRTLTALTLLLTLALTFGWLPTSAPVRAWLGSLLVEAAAEAGVTLAYAGVAGYAWRGLALVEPRLTAEGLNLAADRVAVAWFLPALLVGELPLRLDVAGLRGDVELGRLEWLSAAFRDGDGGAPPALRVRIDAARLDGADLRVAEVPFALPDLRVERLEATALGEGAWQVATTVATDDGRLEGEIRGRLGEPGLEVTLHRGDARVARRWWDGIDAGVVSGEARWGPGGADARFEVQDGALTAYGVQATAVSGPVVWRGDVFEASWTGTALGGRLEAAGTVDVGAATWQAEALVEVALPDASAALLRLLGAPTLPAADGGVVRGRVTAEGWSAVDLAAVLQVDGAWLAAPLVVDDLRVGFTTAHGVQLAADGRWGEGPLRLQTDGRAAPTTWWAELGPVRVLGVPVASVEATWTTGAGPVAGRALLRGGEGPWWLDVDLVLDDEGLQAYLAGALWGGPLEGAIAAATATGGAPLEGEVRWLPEAGLASGTPRVTARLAGTLAVPRATVALDGDGLVVPLAPVGVDVDVATLLPGLDLRGAVEAAWLDGGLRAAGRFGPVALQGEGDAWQATVDALALGGPVTGGLGPARLDWRPEGWAATLRTAVAAADPVPGVGAPWWSVLEPIDWQVVGGADGWVAVDASGAWRLSSEDGGRLSATAVPIALAGRPARLDAAGTLAAGTARAELAGAAVDATWDASGLGGTLATGERRLAWRWEADGRLRLDGEADLAVLADGLAGLGGTLSVAAAWRPADEAAPSGRATLALATPWPVEAELVADGSEVVWRASAELLGERLRSAGAWRPGADPPVAGTLAWGDLATLRVGLDGLSGEGVWAGWGVAGVVVPPQAWRLALIPDGQAVAVVGDSALTFAVAERRLDAAIDLRLGWGDGEARARGVASWSPERPDGHLDLALALPGTGEARIAGDLRGLEARLSGPVADWFAAAAPALGPGGAAALAGELTGTVRWLPGDDFTAELAWRDRAERPVTLTWSAGAGSVAGEGWRLRLAADGALELEAADARLDPLLRSADVGVRVDGRLRLPLDDPGGAQGALDATVAVAGVEAVARLFAADGLHAEASATVGPAAVSAGGPVVLVPRVAWLGAWRVDASDPVAFTGTGSFQLDGGALSLGGALDLPAGEAGPLAWPALGLGLALLPDGTWVVDGRDGLAGSWPAGLRAGVELAGDPATITLRPAERGWEVGLAGDAVDARWSGDAAAWRLAATARAAGRELRVAATGEGTTAEGTWSAGDAPGAAARDGAAWAGGTLALADTTLTVVLRGEEVALQRALRLPPEAILDTRGELVASWTPASWSVDGRLETVGTPLPGIPTSLRLDAAGRGATIDLGVEAGGAVSTWRARTDDLAGLPESRWDLVGRVLDVPLSGSLHTDAAGAALELADTQGDWRVEAAGATEGRAVLGGPQGLTAAVSWSLAPTLAFELDAAAAGFALVGRIAAAPDGTTAPWLWLDVTHRERTWRANVIGPLAPLELQGALAVTDLAYPLALVAAPAWRLTWGSLDAHWADGTIVVDGHSAPGQLPFVALLAEGLAWGPRDGWAGGGELTGAWIDADLSGTATLRGAGDLSADVAVAWAGAPVGGARLTLGADPTAGLQGEADLLLPLGPDGAWTLAARGPLATDGASWHADLALDFDGPVAAVGRARAVNGVVDASLVGPGVELVAGYRDGAADGRLRVRDFDLAEALPWIAEPRLSGDAFVDYDPEGWRWRVDALRLSTAGGLIEAGGVGGPNGRVEASARLDVDLADLRLDENWSGRVRGPLSFDGTLDDPLAGLIAARLDARDVAWGGLAATWRGEVVVTGSAGDPALRATWVARGDAAQLDGEASWQPAAERMAVRAEGTLGGADLRLDLALAPAGFAGDGEVAWRDSAWRIDGDGGRLRVRGLGPWAPWRATLDPDGWWLDLAGDLSVLPTGGGAFEGRVDLGADDRPVVALAWRDAAVAGFELGDGTVTGDAASGWRAAGERVRGELAADLSAWSLELAGLVTPVADTRLTLAAAAEPGRVAIAGTWVGSTPAGPVDLRVELQERDGDWHGALAGDALGGRVSWPVGLTDGRWTGSGRLEGGSLAGLPVAATLELAGARDAPAFALGLTAGEAGAWRADLSWRDGAALVAAVVPLPGDRSVTVRGRAFPDVDLLVDGGRDGRVRVVAGWTDEPLRLEGDLDLQLGPVEVVVRGPTTLQVSVPELGGGLRAALPGLPLLAAVEEVRRDGWRWIGVDGWRGTARVGRADGPTVELVDLTLGWAGATATLTGDVAVDAARLELTIALGSAADALAAAGAWPWAAPIAGRLTWDGAALALTTADPWGLEARVSPADETAWLAVDVRGDARAGNPAPSARGRLALDADGWSGELRLETVTEALGSDPATLELTVSGEGAFLALAASLRGTRGSATASGRWDGSVLRPVGWETAQAAPLRAADLRVVGLDLAGFAGAASLAGTVTGSATLRGDRLFGRLTSEALTLGQRTEPAWFEFQADLRAADGPRASGRLDLGGADVQVEADLDGVAAFVRLERFPLHELVAAAIGPSDVVAEATGALRAAWGWRSPVPHDLRVASEHLVLERGGVVTRGELAFEWDGTALTIGRSVFEGRGSWALRGRADPELLDLELLAQGADFGPLLGLVPALAGYGVTAQGDLLLSASGTPSAPNVVVRTDDLQLGVAGTRYRLEDVRITLRGDAWSGRAEIAGIAPLTGRLTLVTDGRVGPWPDEGFALAARAVGELDVPFVGRVDEIVADLAWSDAAAPQLRVEARLGAPFTVSGPLSPLDLRASGRDLRLGVPFLAVADAVIDAELRLLGDAAGVRVSGRIDASQARVDLASRAAFVADADPPAGAPAAPIPALDPRERVRFDSVRLVAPQRVTFAESFGNAEAAVDLTLDGTAAAPRLSGVVRALRGTVRFAGRELELTEAIAAFDPTRGVLPSVRLAGRAVFEKARVVPPGETLRFVAPLGPRFAIDLLLVGEALAGPRGFGLDLVPTLTSDAIVEGAAGAGGSRPLSELELLTVLTLGRLEGTGGVAGAVAQSALDTAVDLFLTGEIQTALAEALGVDVVELRTSAVSTLIDGGDPFGVSLRLGAYVSDEVFASYRVSTLGGDAFSNEVAFAYQLGPVAMDVTGRIDVAAGTAATAGPSLAIGARYGFAPGWALELGVDLSTQRSTARLGVTWRW